MIWVLLKAGQIEILLYLIGILNTGFQKPIPGYIADRLAQWLTSKPHRSTTRI